MCSRSARRRLLRVTGQGPQGRQRVVVAHVHHQIALAEIAYFTLHVGEAGKDFLGVGVVGHAFGSGAGTSGAFP